MKKLLSVILLLIATMTFSGCFSSGNKSDTAIGREQAEEILRCLNEDDIEGLKSMFCKEISDTHNLDKEIAEAMEFFDGEADSYDKVLVGGGESIESGKVVDKHIWYNIKNIKCNTQKTYFIATSSYLLYNKKPDCIGITFITIFDEDTGDKLEIGEDVY